MGHHAMAPTFSLSASPKKGMFGCSRIRCIWTAATAGESAYVTEALRKGDGNSGRAMGRGWVNVASLRCSPCIVVPYRTLAFSIADVLGPAVHVSASAQPCGQENDVGRAPAAPGRVAAAGSCRWVFAPPFRRRRAHRRRSVGVWHRIPRRSPRLGHCRRTRSGCRPVGGR